jgi:hypothetical protein
MRSMECCHLGAVCRLSSRRRELHLDRSFCLQIVCRILLCDLEELDPSLSSIHVYTRRVGRTNLGGEERRN